MHCDFFWFQEHLLISLEVNRKLCSGWGLAPGVLEGLNLRNDEVWGLAVCGQWCSVAGQCEGSDAAWQVSWPPLPWCLWQIMQGPVFRRLGTHCGPATCKFSQQSLGTMASDRSSQSWVLTAGWATEFLKVTSAKRFCSCHVTCSACSTVLCPAWKGLPGGCFVRLVTDRIRMQHYALLTAYSGTGLHFSPFESLMWVRNSLSEG